jgi:hypothetical protein
MTAASCYTISYILYYSPAVYTTAAFAGPGHTPPAIQIFTVFIIMLRQDFIYVCYIHV